MYCHVWINMILVASKLSSHCSIVIVFNVKYMTLESVYDSVSSLSYIFCLAPVALCAVDLIIVLAGAILHCIVVLVIKCIFFIFPDWEISLQYLHEFGLLQP